MRLIQHDYGKVGDNQDKKNRKPALFIFYSLALAEATLFLMERAFWEWRVRFCRLLDHVNEECELGPSGMVSIRRFFYDAYSRCVNGSIFDGLQMDMFTFATDLLASNSPDEQVIGNLARDHDNCGKIGKTRGLLSRIIDFSHAEERLLKNKNVAESQIDIVKRSLQVLKKLAATTGTTGKKLRKEISERVFTISNIRHILRYGEMHPRLQKHGIDILTSLAQESEATERIGNTGGVLKYLFDIFFTGGTREDPNKVRTAAGDALAYLALGSENNCHRILNLHVLERLVGALEDPLLRINAARILRHLCSYSDPGFSDLLKGVTAAAPTLMTPEESGISFEKANVTEAELATALFQILDKHRYPPVEFPRIRRFAIELAIWMMRDNKTDVSIFKDMEMKRVLENVLETTAEFESFNIVSGTVGLKQHRNSIHSWSKKL
ncbi:hypothetical protein CJ030_MR5G027212 [Morella rubra]|uniref:Uncharacterized protein n=1 Tax=Morella rubra TaxID=262757 RepID=A0A6A1VNA4_9ROSI|nr:hypothetical protein CJ030_MR5G027212 [Morella rubra]